MHSQRSWFEFNKSLMKKKVTTEVTITRLDTARVTLSLVLVAIGKKLQVKLVSLVYTILSLVMN